MRATIHQIARQEDQRHQRDMWQRMNRRCRLCTWAPIAFAAVCIVAMGFVGTAVFVQTAAQL